MSLETFLLLEINEYNDTREMESGEKSTENYFTLALIASHKERKKSFPINDCCMLQERFVIMWGEESESVGLWWAVEEET